MIPPMEADPRDAVLGSRMRKRMSRPDLLEAGIYTIPEAAELVGAPQSNVRVWR
jgi:hypothetical protein